MSIVYNRRFRVWWGVVSAVGAVGFVCLEVALRTSGRWSTLAPSTALFTLGIVAGLVCGVLGAAWEHYLLLHKRGWMSKFHGLQVRERFRWGVQKENWAMNGWFFAAMLVLLACCSYWSIFVLPPLLAANAVQSPANKQLVADFNAELSSAAG